MGTPLLSGYYGFGHPYRIALFLHRCVVYVYCYNIARHIMARFPTNHLLRMCLSVYKTYRYAQAHRFCSHPHKIRHLTHGIHLTRDNRKEAASSSPPPTGTHTHAHAREMGFKTRNTARLQGIHQNFHRAGISSSLFQKRLQICSHCHFRFRACLLSLVRACVATQHRMRGMTG